MAKKIKQQQAGKKRASTSLRDSKGRFTSNLFKREVLKSIAAKKGIDVSKDEKQKDRTQVDNLLKELNISNSELQKEYKSNIEIFANMIKDGGTETTYKSHEQIKDAIDNYKGRFVLIRNGFEYEMSGHSIKYQLQRFKTVISSFLNTADFSQRLLLTYSGVMKIEVPEISDIIDIIENGEDKVDTIKEIKSLFEDRSTNIYGS